MLLAHVLVWSLLHIGVSADEASAATSGKRSRTVEFFAGQHTGSTGANHNAKNDFPAQSFRLAETNASIVDAYVEVSAHIGALAQTSYASSYVYFDACVPACTPSTAAFTSTGSLGGAAKESQFIRFRAPVTSEADLAAYTGGGAARTFAVGYCFSTATTCSGTAAAGIFGTSAKLVLTYTYDANTANETNTVLYPLESAADVAAKTAGQLACTMDTNCPKFGYTADIPDLAAQSDQVSQWFRLHVVGDVTLTTVDQTYTPQIDGNASGGTHHFEQALGDQGAWMDHYASGLPGYANNTAQQLEYGVSGDTGSAMGGENVVTYTRSSSAATKTRTVTFPVGEVITASGSTIKSALTGPTVYFPETGVSIRKAWFRAQGSMSNTASTTLSLSTTVGSRAETAQTAYALKSDNVTSSKDGYFTHLIPAADYAEMAAAGASTGKAVQLSAQWGSTVGGSVSAELVVTYQYTGDSNGYLSTQRILAGQQMAAPATTFTTATGEVNPALPDPGVVVIRGGSLETNAKNIGMTAGESIGSNLSTGSCTATATSTFQAPPQYTRFGFWKDVTATVTNSDAQTYTACYVTTQDSVFSGALTVTYQVTPPSAAPAAPTSVEQRTPANDNIIVGGSTNDATVVFSGIVSDPDNPSTLQLCVEVDPVGTAFSGTDDTCGPTVNYTGTALGASVSRTLDPGNYHWQIRTRDATGATSAWVSFGGNAETATDVTIVIAPKRSRTVEFFAGQHTGSTGANHNVKNDFPAQSFRLAEKDAKIVDAYVEVSAQIGAAGGSNGNSATTYASSYIYFDACVPACSPSPTAFTSTAGLGTAAESQFVRFRASVTSEADLAAYTGAGAARSFAVGYCFATTASCTGTTLAELFGVSAKLVLTYTYDATSANETNTVLYPLESATDVGSRTTPLTACTMDTNCPLLGYNAAIPDLSVQESQWFRVHGLVNTTTTTDQVHTPQVDGNASGGTYHHDGALSENGGWVDYFAAGLPGYANNTAQSLELGVNSGDVTALGGENVVTYTRAASAATKTRTVSLPIGEVIAANASTTKSALTGPTVFLPETGLTIRKAWLRVHASPTVGGTSTLMLSTKVGTRAETAQTSYSLTGDTMTVSLDGYLTHVIPAADYAELAAAGASAGKAVQLAAQWGGSNPGGAVSAELMITYAYTGEGDGYLTTQRLLAGQQTTAAATTFTTATGALDPAIPETPGVAMTIRGASLELNAKATGTTANEAVGSSLSTGACTSSLTSTVRTAAAMTRVTLWKDVTATVIDTDTQTYTACYATTQASVFSGTLTVTYQVPPPPSFQASAYRWFGNADAANGTDPVDVGSALAAQDTTATAPAEGTPFRLRLAIHVATAQLPAGSFYPLKLQVAAQSGTCDPDFTGETYQDVVPGAGAIRYHDNVNAVDAQPAASNAADPVHSGHTLVRQAYEEGNSFTATTAVPAGQDGMWDFALITNSAPANTTYCFRFLRADGPTVSAPLVVPQITTASSGNTAPNAASSLSQRTAADAVLAVGAWHNNGSITFQGSVSDPDASDTLALCVEVDPLGTAFSGTEDACGTGVTYSGAAVTASLTRTLAAGEYHWQVRVKDAAGAYSSWVSFDVNAESARDVGIDLTAPVAGSVYDGTTAGADAAFSNGSLTSLSGNWDGFSDPASGLARYDIAVGITAGGTEILAWTNANLDTTATPTGLTLTTGVVYYVSVRAVDNAGNTTTATSNGQQVTPTLGFTLTALASGASCGEVTTNTGATAATLTFRPLSLAQLIAGANLTITTNAATGYTVTTAYTGPATGVRTGRAYLNATGSNATPAAWPAAGTEAFGYTTSSTTLSGTANRFTGPLWAAFNTTNAEIMRGTAPTTAGTTNCLAISLSKATTTPADTYTTTLRYTITPAF